MYAIESYAHGFIVARYQGNSAHYTGKNGKWQRQPIGLVEFPTKEDAEKFVNTQPELEKEEDDER